MTNDEDMMIREIARSICADQASKQDNDDWTKYSSGAWDDNVWMRLTEEGIRRGIKIGRSL